MSLTHVISCRAATNKAPECFWLWISSEQLQHDIEIFQKWSTFILFIKKKVTLNTFEISSTNTDLVSKYFERQTVI